MEHLLHLFGPYVIDSVLSAAGGGAIAFFLFKKALVPVLDKVQEYTPDEVDDVLDFIVNQIEDRAERRTEKDSREIAEDIQTKLTRSIISSIKSKL